MIFFAEMYRDSQGLLGSFLYVWKAKMPYFLDADFFYVRISGYVWIFEKYFDSVLRADTSYMLKTLNQTAREACIKSFYGRMHLQAKGDICMRYNLLVTYHILQSFVMYKVIQCVSKKR